MFKGIFLQFGGEDNAYDIFMDIGEYFQGFHEGIVAFASSIFGFFGFWGKSIQKTKFNLKNIWTVNLHGPSLGIGAGIAAVAIFVTFLAFDNITDEKELVLEQAENIQPNPQKIGLDVFTENGSPYLGDPNAPITLVEFGDYQCFFCNKYFHETEHNILLNYVETGKVKIIFKDYTIIGPDSLTAAHAAHCADDQGKFWEYHDVLYNNWTGENNGWAGSENLLVFAQQVGLNIDEFTECMLNEIHVSVITQSNSDARTLGLTGTPGFFVIGTDDQITKIPGAQPYEVFERVFDSELEK